MKVFVDLDGTLNLMHIRWLQEIKRQLGEQLALSDITDWNRLASTRYQDLLKAPGFFRHAGIVPGAQQALQIAQAEGHELFVLSAAGPWNYADKDAWIREYLPFIPIANVIFATCKGAVAGPGKLLVDDGSHNLQAWSDEGGIAVAFDQPWNQDWNGLRLMSWIDLPRLLDRLEAGAA